MRIYLRNNLAKFHPARIWNDGAIGLFEESCPNNSKNSNNKMSSDMGSVPVPDPKGSKATLCGRRIFSTLFSRYFKTSSHEFSFLRSPCVKSTSQRQRRHDQTTRPRPPATWFDAGIIIAHTCQVVNYLMSRDWWRSNHISTNAWRHRRWRTISNPLLIDERTAQHSAATSTGECGRGNPAKPPPSRV